MRGLVSILLVISITSCITTNKLQYLQPLDINKEKWSMEWRKDWLNGKEFFLTQKIFSEAGIEKGEISFEFYPYTKSWMKLKDLMFIFTIKEKVAGFLSQIDFDSVHSKQMKDSLLKKKIGTALLLPYNKFFVVVDDSIYLPVRINEYFLGYEKLRSFRIWTKSNIKDNSKIRFVTGDDYLDSILKPHLFILKRKNRVWLQTHIN